MSAHELKFIDGRQIRWDASSIETFLTCPKLYHLSYLQGYRPAFPALAANFGRAVHRGIELLDEARHGGQVRGAATLHALTGMIEEYGQSLRDCPDGAWNLEAATRAVVWRAEEYWNDTLTTSTMPDGSAALEVRFETPIPNTEYRVSGIIDRLADYQDEVFVIDTKTTKQALGQNYFKYYEPCNQVMVYLWVTRRLLGLPVKGMIIDGVQTGVSFTRFGRQPFYVDDSRIDEWFDSLLVHLKHADEYAAANHYPNNFASCANKGGCKFRAVCSQPLAQRKYWLNEDFVKKVHPDLERTT